MGDKTGISWTDATWNPVVGCALASPGCTNCYAMKEAHRLSTKLGTAKYQGLTMETKTGPVWNGTVRLVPGALDQPLRWKKPRVIFVNSMSDLFAEGLSLDDVDWVVAVMALAHWHHFIVLSKRSTRMLEYLSLNRAKVGAETLNSYEMVYSAMGRLHTITRCVEPHPYRRAFPVGMPWPLPNVTWGVSIEDQQRAEERGPAIVEIAKMGWRTAISAEPLLGRVELKPYLQDRKRGGPGAEVVMAGGESGPRARAWHPDWARAIRDDCADTDALFHWKQNGEWAPVYDRDVDDPPWRRCDKVSMATPNGRWINLAGGHGFHGDRVVRVDRLGKRRAGWLLDGREHHDMPDYFGRSREAVPA